MELDALIEALRRPEAYPETPNQPPEVIQTHASVVFRGPSDVYKLKKPVDLGFLDYSTLDKRQYYAQREVELNRRLAPEIYLGVVPVVEGPEGLVVGGEGTPVDYLVHMRRLPDEATLQSRLAAGEVDEHQLRGLAARLAGFHARAHRDRKTAKYGSLQVVAENCRDNFETIASQEGHTVSPVVLERLRASTEQELDRHGALIEARARQGVPCDTHGDLRCDHVYLFPEREPPQDLVIIDCIEFNERFRYADPVADLAFLVMDLQAHGAWHEAAVLADSYFPVADDLTGRGLLPLYVSYRAAVRGKVEGLKLGEHELSEQDRERALQSARGHLILALGALVPVSERPCLVIVGGLPGSGKSTLARGLAEQGGFHWIRSDVVRKELAGIAPEQSAQAAPGEGIYTREWSERTYAECLQRVREALFQGQRVVVDANFKRRSERRQFAEAAIRWGVPIRGLICEADEAAVRKRLQDPRRTTDASDATFAVYQAAAEAWEPPGAEERGWIRRLDAGGAASATLQDALRHLARARLV